MDERFPDLASAFIQQINEAIQQNPVTQLGAQAYSGDRRALVGLPSGGGDGRPTNQSPPE